MSKQWVEKSYIITKSLSALGWAKVILREMETLHKKDDKAMFVLNYRDTDDIASVTFKWMENENVA